MWFGHMGADRTRVHKTMMAPPVARAGGGCLPSPLPVVPQQARAGGGSQLQLCEFENSFPKANSSFVALDPNAISTSQIVGNIVCSPMSFAGTILMVLERFTTLMVNTMMAPPVARAGGGCLPSSLSVVPQQARAGGGSQMQPCDFENSFPKQPRWTSRTS